MDNAIWDTTDPVTAKDVAYLIAWWTKEQQHHGPCRIGCCGICGGGNSVFTVDTTDAA